MSTTAEDAEIRKRLYRRIGPNLARFRLSERFPSVSAKSEIERRIAAMSETTEVNDAIADSILDVIVDELTNWNHTPESAASSGGKAPQSPDRPTKKQQDATDKQARKDKQKAG